MQHFLEGSTLLKVLIEIPSRNCSIKAPAKCKTYVYSDTSVFNEVNDWAPKVSNKILKEKGTKHI